MRDLRRSPDADRDEDGFTLVELLVAMLVMTIFMGLVTAAVVQMTQVSLKSQAIGDAESQLNAAFLRLDKEVRYASAINSPGQNGSDWYVEFQSKYSGTTTCTQLRTTAAAGKLQQRTWTVTGGSVTAPGWTTLASGVANQSGVAAQNPFTFTVAGATAIHQQLKVYLLASSGPGGTATKSTSTSSATFTALNTGPATVTNTTGQSVCQEVARS